MSTQALYSPQDHLESVTRNHNPRIIIQSSPGPSTDCGLIPNLRSMAIVKLKPQASLVENAAGSDFDPLAPRAEMTEDEYKWLLLDNVAQSHREPVLVHLRGVDYIVDGTQGPQRIIPKPDLVPIEWIDPEQGTIFEQKEYARTGKPLFRRPILFSLQFAKIFGITDAIVYRHLQVRQEENIQSGAHNKRGKVWVDDGASAIYETALPYFGDRQVVLDAINRLIAQRLVLSGNPASLLDEKNSTKRGEDKRLWLHVPTAADPEDDQVSFDLTDAMLHGVVGAILIHRFLCLPKAVFTKSDAELNDYARVVAKQWAEMLPMDEKTVRIHLGKLTKCKVIARHPEHPTYYRLVNRSSGAGKALEEARAFIAWKRTFFLHG